MSPRALMNMRRDLDHANQRGPSGSHRRNSRFHAHLGLILVVVTVGGCALFRGTVNASPSLRWWLFSNFGAGSICPELYRTSAPLKLSPGGNSVGRFFPNRCQTEIHEDRQTMTVHFGGTGYAWTPLAGRIGFSADASVEYRFDFRMLDDAVYVWARTQSVVRGPEFQVGSVENKLVDWATRTPAGYLANTFGAQLMSSQLASGFTVVRTDEGDEFTIGILQPPQRPKRPFDTSEGDKYVFANDTTEIHPGQVDFLGPFEVTDTDQALFMRFRVTGPSVDAVVIHRGTGDLWRDGLQRGAALGPPPQTPLTSFTLQPMGEQRQKLALQPGQYYVVLDNSDRVGPTNPPWNPLGSVGANAAVVAYVAEVGERDDPF